MVCSQWTWKTERNGRALAVDPVPEDVPRVPAVPQAAVRVLAVNEKAAVRPTRRSSRVRRSAASAEPSTGSWSSERLLPRSLLAVPTLSYEQNSYHRRLRNGQIRSREAPLVYMNKR